MAFTVLGSAGETVVVTVVSPPAAAAAPVKEPAVEEGSEEVATPLDGTLIVTTVVVGATGSTKVECAHAACKPI